MTPRSWLRAIRTTFQSQPEYQKMSDGEDDSTTVEAGKNQIHWSMQLPLTWLLIALLSMALVISLGFNLTRVQYQTNAQLNRQERISCGDTLEDAMRKGCVWDELTNAWMPMECPRAGEAEYIAASGNIDPTKSWIVYKDRNGTIPVDRSLMVNQSSDPFGGLMGWWTTEGQHVAHCLYILQRLAYVVHTEDRRDFMVGNINHTTHCIKSLFHMAQMSPTWGNIIGKGQSAIGYC
ncbi:hypothetical protein V8C42DRAFT_338616 [Trichoderma barbatum]